MTESEYIAQKKNVKSSRHHKLSGSYKVRDYYTYFRRHNKDLTETQFSLILKELFKKCGELLLNSKDVILPHRMGKIEIRKFKKDVKFIDGKLHVNLPVDYNATLKLWYSDESARKNKKVIRFDTPWVFRFHYNKKYANYNNMSFIKFYANRELKKKLKDAINNNNLDAFTLWKQMEQ